MRHNMSRRKAHEPQARTERLHGKMVETFYCFVERLQKGTSSRADSRRGWVFGRRRLVIRWWWIGCRTNPLSDVLLQNLCLSSSKNPCTSGALLRNPYIASLRRIQELLSGNW